MNSEEHQQQLEEQQQLMQLWNDQLNSVEGVAAGGLPCDGCGKMGKGHMNEWSVEGFRKMCAERKFDAETLLKQRTGVSDFLLEDCDRVTLCHDCTYLGEW